MYTYPQSVGFAGGRPSSSYYFVGSQADDLFYLDPHHVQPAVLLKPPPPWKRDAADLRTPTSPGDAKHTPVPPSPLQQQYSPSFGFPTTSTSSQPTESLYQQSSSLPIFYASDLDYRCLSSNPQLDELQTNYARSYLYDDLKTFHSTRILKMPFSELDPGMLIGFLCRDEEDWKDFKRKFDEVRSSAICFLFAFDLDHQMLMLILMKAKCRRMFDIQDQPSAGMEADSEDTDSPITLAFDEASETTEE
jgi:cysteine protease ATG4